MVSEVTEPGEVKSDLLSKISPDVIQRLVAPPTGPSGPVFIQGLSQTEGLGGHGGAGGLEVTL